MYFLRSLCKYLYNIYHPCDPVAYRVEPIFMRFYSQIEPIHLHGPTDPDKIPYAEQPLRHLQAARKEEDKVDNLAGVSVLPVNIANGSINISVGKMAAGIGRNGSSWQCGSCIGICPSRSCNSHGGRWGHSWTGK